MNKIQEAKQELQLLVRAAYDQAVADGALPAGMNDEVRVEIPKDPTHGDYATGFAMQAARPLRMAPGSSVRPSRTGSGWRGPSSGAARWPAPAF